MSVQTSPRRGLPRWAVALIVLGAAVLVAGVVVVVMVLRSGSAERQATDACRDAVRSRLGTGVSDVDLSTYSPLVQRTGGSGSGESFRVSGEVDFQRGGEPVRSYYTCEVTRSGDGTTVSSVTGL